MANNEVKYLFVKRKMNKVTVSTIEAEHKKTILNKTQCKCNNKIENKLRTKEASVRQDSEIANTTVDHEYDMLVKTLSLIVNTMKINRNKKRRKYKVYRYCKKEIINLINSLNFESNRHGDRDNCCGVSKTYSTPIVKYNKTYTDYNPKITKSYSESQNKIRFNTDFIVNSCCKTCDVPECINPFINPMVQARVYQCQLKSQENNCCCSCNSDALFEVMKSLYDCYKGKNCDNCDCILCGHLPSEDRKLVGTLKSGVDVGMTTTDSERIKEKLDKANTEGLLTPLDGKTSADKEKILRGLAKAGLPLPDGKSPSEKKIIQKVRLDMGLPPEPKSVESKEKYAKALATGIITPLEGKTPAQKEHVLKRMAKAGISLPEGRTPSEKAIIGKIRDSMSSKGLSGKFPSEKLRKAQAQGLLTPLDGKSPKNKEKILKGLAKLGMPLPEGKTPSEKKLIQKVRKDMGFPPEGKTKSEKSKLAKAYAAGIISPLEGKSADDKKKILERMADAKLPLPEGRTPSEKALIDKILDKTAKPTVDKLEKAKAQGLLTPLKGKSSKQKENILKGLAKLGLPLPEGKSPSEKDFIKKVRNEIGYPTTSLSEKERLSKLIHPEPIATTPSEKLKKAKAEGLITSLDGKSLEQKEKILKGLAKAGLPLPEGKTPSEKQLIQKIRSNMGLPEDPKTISQKQKIENAHAAGIITPLEGKTQAQKEAILRKLVNAGVPLPKGHTTSEKSLIAKIKAEKAKSQGLLTPLEGKSPVQKEKILKGLTKLGLPLPEMKTPSDKKLIEKIKKEMLSPTRELAVPSEKLRRAKDEGLLTPLDGKSPEKKEKILKGLAKAGLPLPEGKTPSEKKIVQKVRHDMGLPVEHKMQSEKKRLAKAYAAGIVSPLEGKSAASKENILRRLVNADILLPEGRTPSEKALIDRVKATTPKSLGKLSSAKLRKAKAEGLFSPLKGKSPEQREHILRGLTKLGLPLPQGNTPSEKKIIKKVRYDMGYPINPRTTSEKLKLTKAHETGLVQALEGKTAPEKEEIIKKLLDAGVILPEGRTSSEKALIARLKASTLKTSISGVPPEKIKKAKALGLLTPLEGKSPQQKQKILKGLGKMGLPLPEGKTPSDKELIQNVRNELGYPSEPRSPSERQRLAKAHAAGMITPLEGKTPAEKEVILKKMAQNGIPLPEGRNPSEKALIDRVKAETPRLSGELPSDMPHAQGPIISLEGKSPQEQEKILRDLAKLGLPLPEGKTPSEKKQVQKIRHDVGYPMDPQTLSQKKKLAEAHAAGIVAPLEGKNNTEKEAIIKKLIDANVPLPEGRTQSEKALIAKLKASYPRASDDKLSTEKMKKAKELGLLTPLEGKPLNKKEEIIRGLAKLGLPLPEGKTTSEKNVIKKVRKEVGYPLEPRTSSQKQKLAKAHAAGLVTTLQGKNPAEKETILKRLAEMEVQLPEGRTPSEKALIAKIKDEKTSQKIPSDKLKKARAEGLLTPLDGKTESQKNRILRGLATAGLPLPEGRTQSEKKLIKKIRNELGLPPEVTLSSEKLKMAKAHAAGIITPLEGKTPAEKEAILKKMADAGIPLPEGRTPSERAAIAKLKKVSLISPLDGKTLVEKENIINGLISAHLPLPEGKTKSEKELITKLKANAGIPPEGATPSENEIIRKAKSDGLFTPIKGKSPQQKEKIIKGLINAGLPIPEGETSSEKALIKKLMTEAGLPLEPTLSEKIGGKKTKSKAIGGIDTEYEDILKTTKCDQSCGCDKKKIRFKHSYIKIRVTSPDISSICPCPNECLPGVKGGVFIDNEGIKVTVGTAVGFPILRHCYSNRSYDSLKNCDCTLNTISKKLLASVHNNNAYKITTHDLHNLQDNEKKLLAIERSDSTKTVRKTMSTEHLYLRHTVSQICTYHEYVVNNLVNDTVGFRGKISEPCLDVLSNHSMSDLIDFPSSDESILIMNSDSSVTLSTISNITAYSATSGISFVALTSNLSAKYSLNNDDKDLECEHVTKEIDCSGFCSSVSSKNMIMDFSKSPFSSCASKIDTLEYDTVNSDVIILRIADKGKKRRFFNRNKKETNKSDKNVEVTKKCEPIVVINDINNCPMTRDVMKKITEILAAKPVDDDSSVFVLVPSDDINTDNEHNMHNMQNNTVGLQIAPDRSQTENDTDPSLKPLCEVYRPKHFKIVPSSRGIKFCTKPKGEKSKETFTNIIDEPCKDVNGEKEPAQTIEHSSINVYTSNETLKKGVQQVNDSTYDNAANVKITSKRCIDRMSPKAASKLQVMFDDLGFERLHVFEPAERTHRMIGVDTTADRPCCCQPCKNNYIDEKENESSLSEHFVSHHELISKYVVSQPKTTDEGNQIFSSPFKSPDLSNGQIQPLPKQPCCCTPKNKYSESLFPSFFLDRSVPQKSQFHQNRNMYNQRITCTSKYNLPTEYVHHSFANNVEPFVKPTQKQLQHNYRDNILYSNNIPVATIKSKDMHYTALSNLNTAYMNSQEVTTKQACNSLSNKQLVVKTPLRNSNKICPLICKNNDNITMTKSNSHISRMPKLILKNPNVICPTTCNHIDGFKRGAVPDKCNQSVGNHDDDKQITFLDNKMDKPRELRAISLKNPNRICPPTCHHVNENMDPNSEVQKNINSPPTCNHVINPEAACDKQDQDSESAKKIVKQVMRTPRRICPPRCSRAERLSFEESQSRQPDNLPFSLVPVPLREGQTNDTGPLDSTTCNHIDRFKQSAVPDKCIQSIGNNDENKQETFPDNKIDKLRELKTISLKNPNRICPPTCRHVNENMDPNSAAVHKIINSSPPTCNHVLNPDAACDKQDQECDSATKNDHQVMRTPRRICPPTCSRAERLSFEELQSHQPDNLPFRLVPVPLREGQTNDTGSRHGTLCAPRCGQPPALENLECEQKKLQMRKRLRETMGDTWPTAEPGGAVLVIDNESTDNQIECTCGSKKSKQSKNEIDCKCNTRQKSKRKKKCLCGDFIPPPPKIAPDLPPLPPVPRAPSSESTQTDEFSFKRSSSGSINLRDEIMLQTEQTQAVSGFKVSNRGNVKKDYSYKEGDLFYDDALVYFDGDIPPEIEVLFETGPWERPPGASSHTGYPGSRRGAFGMPLEGHDACSCEDRETLLKESMCPEEYEKMRQRHKCECPLKSELPPEELGDVTGAGGAIGLSGSRSGMGAIKNGLKFAIGGKGTGSKGLSGICCFDLSIDDNATLPDDISNNDYLIYID